MERVLAAVAVCVGTGVMLLCVLPRDASGGAHRLTLHTEGTVLSTSLPLTSTATAAPTAVLTATASVSATAGASATAAATAAQPPTSTATLLATLPPTVTATATGPATGTATGMATIEAGPTVTLTATVSASASPVQPSSAYVWLPFVQRSASGQRPAPRVWGLQLALEDLPQYREPAIETELPRARELGLGSIRTNLRWDWVEPRNVEPEGFDWRIYDERLVAYADAGFDVLLVIVGYPSWATSYQCGYALLPGMEVEWRQFVRALAQRYGAPRYRIAGWEIGNEVDGKTVVTPADYERSPDWGGGQPTTPYGGCWGDRPAEYRNFLHAAREEIVAVLPEAQITLGGLANADIYDMFHMDFLHGFLRAGGCADIDFLSYHWFPDVPDQPTGPEKLRRLRATLREHGCDLPVWLTETYRLTWPTDPRGEASQIRFLSQELIEVLADPAVERIYWYGWRDYPDELRPDRAAPHRGIVRADGSAKAALPMLPWVMAYTDGRATDISTAEVRAYRFSRSGLPDSYVAWSLTARPSPLEIEAAAGMRAIATYFPAAMLLDGRCCGRAEVPEAAGVVTLWVGSDSIFVRFDSR